jgi:hypothetical protein
MGKVRKYLKEGPLRKLRRESSTMFSTELWSVPQVRVPQLDANLGRV